VKTIRTVADLRAELASARRDRQLIGLVPTMGALHDGHLQLMRRAREDCDLVVVSLFVNPAQFNERADLAAYPRDEARDAELAAATGADYLFAPLVEEVYPAGFGTTVSVAGVTETLEGVHRGRGHFDGVTTVLTKLFNMVSPDVAYFGQKDAQQAIVIKRLVRDLDIPVRIEVRPTVREPDGLALSSRNAHLSSADRARALSLHRALEAVRSAVDAGERDAAKATALALGELASADVEPDYLEVVDAETLAPLRTIDRDALALIAARVGDTRLIDSEPIDVLSINGAGRAAQETNNGRP
jgi:pantoate--beta-alanine ligase